MNPEEEQKNILTSEALQPVQDTIKLPNRQEEVDFTKLAEANIAALAPQAPSQAEQLQGELQGEILSTAQTLDTKQARRAELQQEEGIPEQQRELKGVTDQLALLRAEARAIPLQIQEEFAGRGVTRSGAAPIQNDRLRQNAIKSLTLAATGAVLQGNIALAQQNVANALQAEFQGEEMKLKTLERIYEFNEKALVRIDKKRAEDMKLKIDERNRLLADAKDNKAKIYDIGLEAAKQGAPQDLVRDIMASGSNDEALTRAGQVLGTTFRANMQDKQFQRDLQAAQFDLSAAKFEADMQQHGEKMALEKYKISLIQTEKAYEQAEKEGKHAKAAALKLETVDNKLRLLNEIVGVDELGGEVLHEGLDSRVGPDPAARRVFAIKDKFTGKGSDFAAKIHQLASTETLTVLTNLKAAGGTLGALNEKELLTLERAATAINGWEVRDENDLGIGEWDVSESDFIKEINKLKTLTEKAYERALGDIPVPASDIQEIDSMFDSLLTETASFDPLSYYD